NLASRKVPPSINGTPQRRQNTPNTASRAAMRRSHQSASSRPPATAYPSTAAITGFDNKSRLKPIGPSPSSSRRSIRSGSASALGPAPAQKIPPAPVSTATERSSSASKRRKAAARAAAVSRSIELRASNRLKVTTATSPRSSTCTASMDGRIARWGTHHRAKEAAELLLHADEQTELRRGADVGATRGLDRRL